MRFIENIKGNVLSSRVFEDKEKKTKTKYLTVMCEENDEQVIIVVPNDREFDKFSEVDLKVEINLYNFKGQKGWTIKLAE